MGSNLIWGLDFFRVPFDAKNITSFIIFSNFFLTTLTVLREKPKTNKQKQLKKRKKRKRSASYNTELFHLHGQYLQLYSIFLKQKKSFANEKTSTPTRLAWYTNTTDVSLFGNINIATMMKHYCAVCKFRKIFTNLYLIPLKLYELTYRISSDQYMYIVHFSKCIWQLIGFLNHPHVFNCF